MNNHIGGDGWQVRFGIGRNNTDTTLDRYEALIGPAMSTSTNISKTINTADLEGEYYIKITLFSYGNAYENVRFATWRPQSWSTNVFSIIAADN